MLNNKHLVALDLGTTKFGLVCVFKDKLNNKLSIKKEAVDAKGMSKGMLNDFTSAKEALSNLIKESEEKFGFKITNICVGIAGSHLKSTQIKINYSLKKSQIIDKSLLSFLSEQAHFQATTNGLEAVYLETLGFKIDDRPISLNPLGLSGQEIEAKFFIIQSNQHYLRDVISLVNSCNCAITGFYPEPIASAQATLNSTHKDSGVILLDIGGGTSDGIAYFNGLPQEVFTFNIGGKTFTKDLSIGLGLPYKEAEKVKRFQGISINTPIEVLSTHNKTKSITLEESQKILLPRIDELIHLLKAKIKLPFGSGLVLTGGGSELFGLTERISSVLKVEVHKIPSGWNNNQPCHIPKNEDFSSPKFATLLGLIQLILKDKPINLNHMSYFGALYKKVTTWIHENN
jgi:cell division protein FtsA